MGTELSSVDVTDNTAHKSWQTWLPLLSSGQGWRVTQPKRGAVGRCFSAGDRACLLSDMENRVKLMRLPQGLSSSAYGCLPMVDDPAMLWCSGPSERRRVSETLFVRLAPTNAQKKRQQVVRERGRGRRPALGCVCVCVLRVLVQRPCCASSRPTTASSADMATRQEYRRDQDVDTQPRSQHERTHKTHVAQHGQLLTQLAPDLGLRVAEYASE